MSEFDPWKLETGLLTNYVGEVKEAWFTRDPKYNEGKSLIMRWKMATDQPGDLAEWEEGWPVGSDWTTVDGGETAVHPKGENRTFNQNSQFGNVIRCLGEIGARDALVSRGTTDPRRAETFVGLKVKMEQKVVGKNPTTGAEVTRNMPVEFFGLAGGGVSTAVESTQTQPEVVPSTPPTTTPTTTNGQTIDPVLAFLPYTIQSQVRALAKAFDHGTWVDKCLGLNDGVIATNMEAVMALSDETGLYQRLRASV